MAFHNRSAYVLRSLLRRISAARIRSVEAAQLAFTVSCAVGGAYNENVKAYQYHRDFEEDGDFFGVDHSLGY